MTGFLGEPTKLFMKPENPDFLRRTDGLKSLPSSERRFELVTELSPERLFSETVSILLKLADDRNGGLIALSGKKLLRGFGICGRRSETARLGGSCCV